MSSDKDAKDKKALTTKEPASKKVTVEIVEKAPTTSTDLTPLGDGLQSYLANISKYPLLTKEQEKEIAERYYKFKDPRDAEILVTSNLRFVVKVAADYAKFGNKLIDVIQEGNVGLMHAVKEFNPYKGVRVITYAVWWIKGYIQEYLMKQHSMVRIGTTQNQRKLFYNLEKEKAKLDKMGEPVTTKALAARLDVPEKDVQMMQQRMSTKDMSLDQPLQQSEGSALRVDLESDPDHKDLDLTLDHQQSLSRLNQEIDKLRDSLNPKELTLLVERILADEPKTLQDIGNEWGVTREAVRQMEARVIKKIKKQMLSEES